MIPTRPPGATAGGGYHKGGPSALSGVCFGRVTQPNPLEVPQTS